MQWSRERERGEGGGGTDSTVRQTVYNQQNTRSDDSDAV